MILRWLRRSSVGAALAAFAAPGAYAEMPPDVLVKTVTLEVVDIVAKDQDIRAGDRRKVIDLVEAKVLPHFNFTSMTALAMGQNWSKASPEQKRRLTEEFKTLLVRTYASALAAYRDQKFDFRPLRMRATDTDVTVQVRVIQSGAQPVSIDYGMEKTAHGWKVYDVTVGGVSLVVNYRTEFNNQVREAGVEGLIRNLQAKNHSLASDYAAAEKK
jgi:phospholipid transport system substrate-binding protein